MSRFERARRKLGENFISPDRIEIPGLVYGPKTLYTLEQKLEDVFSVLGSRKDVLLLPGPGNANSIIGLRRIFPNYFWTGRRKGFCDNCILNELVNPQWYAIPESNFFRDLDGRSWEDQYEIILREGLRVPNTPELVWAIILQRIVNSKTLFDGKFMRTSSIFRGKDHISILPLVHRNRGIKMLLNAHEDSAAFRDLYMASMIYF